MVLAFSWGLGGGGLKPGGPPDLVAFSLFPSFCAYTEEKSSGALSKKCSDSQAGIIRKNYARALS